MQCNLHDNSIIGLLGATLLGAVAGTATAAYTIQGEFGTGGGTASAAHYECAGTVRWSATGTSLGATYDVTAGGDVAPAGAECPADLNGDDSIGFTDLNIALGAWGACDAACPGDLNADGSIGFADLNLVLSAWGACP